jgi:hypothetical protein
MEPLPPAVGVVGDTFRLVARLTPAGLCDPWLQKCQRPRRPAQSPARSSCFRCLSLGRSIPSRLLLRHPRLLARFRRGRPPGYRPSLLAHARPRPARFRVREPGVQNRGWLDRGQFSNCGRGSTPVSALKCSGWAAVGLISAGARRGNLNLNTQSVRA